MTGHFGDREVIDVCVVAPFAATEGDWHRTLHHDRVVLVAFIHGLKSLRKVSVRVSESTVSS